MHAPALRAIRNFKQLVRYLEDELGWPLDGYDIEDLTYDYEADELGLKPADAAKVKAIRQLRPLDSKQPWGIFFIEFDKKKLPVVVLRRILSHLVVKKRASANKADRVAWSAEDLLFISAFGTDDDDGREISFAHFHQEEGDMPTLRVLGWDGGDTSLKLDHLAVTLKQRLHWPDPKESLDHWRARWAGVFRHRIGHVINTSDMLADAMAVLAKRIRDAAQTLIDRESDKGPLRKLHQAFKTHLIHDLTEEGFADTYAQTITYGLLTAAISRTEMSEGRHGTALVAGNVSDMVPVTNPFLKEMLQTFLHVGGRKGGIDFDELGVQDVVELLRGDETDLPAILRDFGNKTRGEDPVIHFYEHFLNAYNKKLRIQRGVFYTPNPAVSYIVRSAHELLQTEFGLEHGLADTTTWGEFISRNVGVSPALSLPPLTDEPGCTETISPDEFFVQILDPATGTATFPVEVIDVIYNHLKSLWNKGGASAMPPLPLPENCKLNTENFAAWWNCYVPWALLPRLHAYELMMAPYAIAHMKIGLKLAETGYNFATEERARIYLTNALEPWQKQLPLIGFDALAHEAAAVNEIKRHKRFTVVIGNPPYSIQSANLNETARKLVEDYKFVDGERIRERNALQFEKNLQDDYIKFIRLAELCIHATGRGIVGYISNDSFLDSRSFRGMRQHLISSFPAISVLDLHGSQKKSETDEQGNRDENVFDIQQGVCISLMRNVAGSAGVARSERADNLGTRTTKYEFLSKHALGTTTWVPLTPASPFYLLTAFEDEMGAEYSAWPSLRDVVIKFSSGIKTHKDKFAYAFSAREMRSRLEEFVDAKVPESQLRDEYGLEDTPLWQLTPARQKLRNAVEETPVVSALYRPFDIRAIVYSEDIVRYTARPTMQHLDGKENLALLVSQQQITEGFAHAFVTRIPADWGSVSNKSRESTSIFPLFLHGVDPGKRVGELFRDSPNQANFTPAFLKTVSDQLGTKPTNDLEIFDYAYSILHSRTYRARYASLLKSDFPRLPLTGNLALFCELSRLGGELVALHLLESPKLDKPITEFIQGSVGVSPASSSTKPGGQDAHAPVVTRIGWSDDTVWLDAPATKKGALQAPGSIGFRGVPEAVWNFHIGGYQVCEKWLKDRKGRTLTAEDIAHYHKIVIALNETIRLMAEIDQVIETHGGWPGAFSGAASESSRLSESTAKI